METCFALAERIDSEKLNQEIETIRHDPAIEGVLRLSGGLLLVIDAHRQIVAINHNLLKDLGVDDIDEIMGLRPGEALDCVHLMATPLFYR